MPVRDISAKPSDKQIFQLICFTASKQASIDTKSVSPG